MPIYPNPIGHIKNPLRCLALWTRADHLDLKILGAFFAKDIIITNSLWGRNLFATERNLGFDKKTGPKTSLRTPWVFLDMFWNLNWNKKKLAQKQKFPFRNMGFCCYAGSVTPRVELLSGQLYCERHNCCGSWSFLYSLLLLHCCLLLFQTGPLSLLNMSTTV